MGPRPPSPGLTRPGCAQNYEWGGHGVHSLSLQPTELVQALEALAARLGIPVRYDAMDRTVSQGRAGGGLCRLRGQPMILVDQGLGMRDRVAVLAQALGTFDLDGIYLPPIVRATIQAHGKARMLEPRPLARTKRDRSDD